jgi:hypothetical protein
VYILEGATHVEIQSAERRGFAPGGETEDWLEAERELLEREGASVVG